MDLPDQKFVRNTVKAIQGQRNGLHDDDGDWKWMCAGKASKFTVVTANAGAGILAALVEGPSKVALTCSEVADGYEFSYTPMAPGNYMIMVKYSNITIAGAPFKAVVTG